MESGSTPYISRNLSAIFFHYSLSGTHTALLSGNHPIVQPWPSLYMSSVSQEAGGQELSLRFMLFRAWTSAVRLTIDACQSDLSNYFPS
jgi:hypothetical protein